MARSHKVKVSPRVKGITYRGLTHSVLSELSRTAERGPRPFETREFSARLKEKADNMGHKLGPRWHTYALNALQGAVDAGLVRTRGANQFSVTSEGRARYRSTRSEVRTQGLSGEAHAIELARSLEKATGPSERRTKGQILMEYVEFKARHTPQRRPLAEQQWQSQSTITDYNGSQEEEDDFAIPLDPVEEADPADETATVRVYNTPARALPLHLQKMRDEHLARDRAHAAAAGAYPTPDSVQRVGGNLEDRDDPVTPTRGGATNHTDGENGYQGDAPYYGSQREDDVDQMEAELPQANSSFHHVLDWASTVIDDDTDSHNRGEVRRYLTRSESSYTIADGDYIHPTIVRLQEQLEQVTQERDTAREAYDSDAELFDAYSRGIKFLTNEHTYMLKCKLDKANEKIEILSAELAELREKYSQALKADNDLRAEVLSNGEYASSIAQLAMRDCGLGPEPSEELLSYMKAKDESDVKIARLEAELGAARAQCLRAQQMLAAHAEEDARAAEEMRLRAERRKEGLAALN
ncbi:hypothetical protein PsYK624_071020 [Phanerochaete sordida]|uniref:Uncharacterized protein n=1 Tax=Phanerochaete sordida TaxID=48140 RepID=A0A9P3LD73_9APHY|nr:hypothetical protein PsYK624_071020 [Phanerochaete sordida]